MSARQTAPRPKRRRASAPADRFEAQARRAETARPDSAPPRIDAAPAGPRLSGLGSGRPLPGAARLRAEIALGADLGAVRLHTGPAAAPHLEAAGVAAMAAGPDILATEAARLDRPEGEPLLLHELAHVLQQTGLRGPDGRLRATPRHGRGRAYGEGGPLEGENAPSREDLHAHLIRLHSAPAPGDRDLQTVIDRISGLTDPEGAEGERLAAEVSAGRLAGAPVEVADMSRAARGLLFDVLKFNGHDAEALGLLVADQEIRSAAIHEPFITHLLGNAAALAAIRSAEMEERTEPYRLLTRRFPAAVWVYLMTPGRQIQSIYDLDPYVSAIEAEATDWAQLGCHDGTYHVSRLLSGINEIQAGWLREGEARYRFLTDPERGGDFGPLRFRRAMAAYLAGVAGDAAQALPAGTGMETVALALDIVAERARMAEAYWAQVLGRVAQLLEARPEDLERLPETALVVRMRERVQEAGLSLLETPDNAFLPGGTYRTRRTALERVLDALAEDLDEAIRAAPPEAGPDPDPGLGEDREVAGILRAMVEAIRAALHTHTEETAGASAAQLADLQHAQRIKTARMLGWFGRLVGSDPLVNRAEEVAAGDDVQAHTLILLSDWEEDSSAPLSDMRDEMAAGGAGSHRPISFSVGEGEEARDVYLPLTIDNLIDIYGLFYTRRLAASLENALQQPIPDTPQGPGQRTLLQEAYTAARGNDRPMRWQVEDFIYIRHDADPRNFRTLLQEHHRTLAQLRPQNPDAAAIIYPNGYTGDAFAWVIPPLDPLIEILRRVDFLNAMVADWIGRDPDSLTAPEWIEILSYVVENDSDALDSVMGAVAVTLGELQDVEDARLAELLPRVMSHERRRLAVEVRAQLRLYANDDLLNYEAPNDAETMIRRYLAMVAPDTLETPGGVSFLHGQAQLTILMLSLSEQFEAAFNPDLIMGYGRRAETRYDVITGFTPYLRQVLAASVEARRGQLEQLMSPEEIAAMDYQAARGRLQAILTGFEEAAREMSARMALISTGSALRSNLYASEITPSQDPFMFNGRPVRLLRIFRPFVFLPAYGRGDGEVTEAQLLDGDRQPLVTSDALVRLQFGDAAPFDITGELTPENIPILMFLRDIVLERSFAQSMENLQEVMRFAGELALDLAEFLPVVGPAVMVGRIIYEVAQFLSSDEFDSMLAVIRGDPVALIVEMLEGMRETFFDPGAIWEFLLFESTVLDFLRDGDQDEDRRRRRPRSRAGRFARIAWAIGEIPITMLDRLHDVRGRVRPRVVSIQAFVAGNPMAARALLFAAMLARNAPAMAEDLAAVADALGSDDPEAALDARLSQMLTALNEIELPLDPIPNDLIIAAMIEFIMERLERMGRIGKMLRVSNTVLQAIGAYDQIAGLIASAIAGTAMDPNEVWRTQMLPDLTGSFEQAKRDFVASANATLDDFGFTGMDEPAPVTVTGRSMLEDGPEASRKPDPAARPDPAAGRPAAIGAGRPLPQRLARRSAIEFGHDFSHVRLHQSADAAELTRRYGAMALTSGSHVFLKPGLSPDTGTGARIFRHELAHVLQHTGSSPLAAGGTGRSPVSGRPGKGLRLNRAEEAAADRAADRAGASGHRLDRPIAAGSGPAGDGLSPALPGGLFARILERFTEPADIDEFLRSVPVSGLRGVPGHRQAIRVWDDFARSIGTASMRQLEGQLRPADVFGLVETHANARVGAVNGADKGRIYALAQMTQRPLANPPSGQNADTTELDLRAFVNVLEAFIYADMGLTVSIRLEATGDPRGVAQVTFKSIDLGRIDGITEPLWVKFFDETDAYLRGRGSTSTRPMPGSPLSTSNKRLIYEVAHLRRPEEPLMPRTRFRADAKFLENIQRLRNDTPTVPLMPWAQYTNVRAGQPGFADSSGGGPVQHKLRLGTHTQLTGEFNTENRDSHHVPQFLFVEYFQNKASTPMFPTSGGQQERLPGFGPANASQPTQLRVGARTIDYGALDPGSSRGGNVPAISLATRTHKTGRLHVGGSSTWPEDGDTFPHSDSQSGQVHSVFRSYAMRRLRAAGAPQGGDDIDADFREVADWARAAPNQGRVQEAVFDAMRDTYRWMYFGVMRPALDRALRTEEPRFYIAAMIERNGPGPLPTGHDPYQNMGATRAVMTQVDAMQDTGALAEFAS